MNNNKQRKLSISDTIEAWVKDTLNDYVMHPEKWPIKKESPIQGYDYWAGLKIESAPYRGDGQWNLYVLTSFGPNASIEISSRICRGTDNDLMCYMRNELNRNVAETLFFIEHLCEKVEEKGEDYHSDIWDDFF